MNSRANFAFVLVRPQYPGNIGAAARALKNMGFTDLRMVAPKAIASREATAMAVHARDVLDAAHTFADLAAATADRTIVAGTTCRAGLYRSAAKPLRESALELARAASSNRIALVFGSEDRGLTNHELKACHRLITIPTAPEYRSLNLAQSVMLVAYELMLATGARVGRSRARQLAAADATNAMLERLAQALVVIGFAPADNPDHIMFAIREMFGRAGLSAREVEILNGMARQIAWVAAGGAQVLDAKRRAGRKLR